MSTPSLPQGLERRIVKLPEDECRIREIVGQIWQGGAYAILEQEHGVIGGKPWQEWQANDVIEWISAPTAEAHVVTRDSEIVAFCSLQIDRERSLGTVGYNGVAPECQGMGLGSFMMAYIMERLTQEGLQYAAVIVADNAEHTPARRVYEKHGFQKVYGLQYLFQKLS